MSSTRSPIPRGPVTERTPAAPGGTWREAALILVGHGSRRCPEVARTFRRHAAALAERRLFAEVRTALLHDGPSPKEVLAECGDREVYVVPMLMCAGHVVSSLPGALGLQDNRRSGLPRLQLCPPLGLHPALGRLAACRAIEAASGREWPLKGTSLLLVAHGSRSGGASRRAAQSQAGVLRAMGIFGTVAIAFLEEPPSLADALARCTGPVIAAGLFAAAGVHAEGDVVRILARLRRTDVCYLGAIGADPAIPDVILEIVGSARTEAA